MSKELENLIGRRFIQRTDVKAIQRGDVYAPHTDTGKHDGNRIGWNRQAIRDHIEGRVSYGHYLVDTAGMSKLFAFDIDLAKADPDNGKTFTYIGLEPDGTWSDMEPRKVDPRAAWAHPKLPDNLKRFIVMQMQTTAADICMMVEKLFDVPLAVAYSGAKGLHVYAMTGEAPAADCQAAGLEVMKALGGAFEPMRGKCFFGPTQEQNDNPKSSYSLLEIEVFPKQINLDGKDLGNLMRLPLGKNAKGGRSFFVTLATNIDEFTEADPVKVLEGGYPWEK